jgi:hypothetical protein
MDLIVIGLPLFLSTFIAFPANFSNSEGKSAPWVKTGIPEAIPLWKNGWTGLSLRGYGD